MGIFFGLASALGWGIGDFFAGYSTRRVGVYRTIFFSQLVGVVGLSIYLLIAGQLPRLWQPVYLVPWLWTLVAALLNIGCAFLFYRAFQVGTLAIISPIVSSYAVVTVILSVLSGETLSPLHTLGITAAMIGIVLTATSLDLLMKLKQQPTRTDQLPVTPNNLWLHLERRFPPGVLLAIIASIGYGVLFWLLGFHVTPFLGGIAPVWLIRLSAIVMLPWLARPLGQRLNLPRRRAWLLLLGAGTFDTLGYVANTLGLATGQVAIVSVFASFFSAVTVLLAWIFLHDRLRWNQWRGIIFIFLGIVLVHM